MLDKVKLLLGITDDSKDELLQYLIEDCTNRSLTYCRRTELPEGMKTLIPMMAVRAYRVGNYGNESEEASVTSWKQGERSESYEDGSVKRDDWINDFRARLEPFRIRRGKLPSAIKEV